MYPQVSLVSAAQACSAFLLTIFLEQLHGVCGDLLKLLGYCGKAVEFFGGCSSHHSNLQPRAVAGEKGMQIVSLLLDL